MEKKDHYILAIISLIVGILSLPSWLLPICGFPISITALITGIVGLQSSRRWMAIVGIVLSVVSLVLTVANAAIGFYLGLTGQLFELGVPQQVPLSLILTPPPVAGPSPKPYNLDPVSTVDSFPESDKYAQTRCLSPSEIGLHHVGSTLCVKGFVLSAYRDESQHAFFITFERDPSSFYLLSYDFYIPDLKRGACVQIEGKIERLGNSPVIVLKPNHRLWKCSQ